MLTNTSKLQYLWYSWLSTLTIAHVIFLQSHQQHHAASEVALTVRSMFSQRKF